MDIIMDAKVFVRDWFHAHLERRDYRYLQSRTAEEISWIGTGGGKICKSRADAERAAAREQAVWDGRFRITGEWYEAVPLSGEFCAVYGVLELCEDASVPTLLDMRLRFTAICKNEGGVMRMLHFHLSFPGDEENMAVPKQMILNYEQRLEKDLRERTEELETKSSQLETLTENIPGGVFIALLDEEFTLLFVNDGYLDLLGYTNSQLTVECGYKALRVTPEEDRSALRAGILEQFRRRGGVASVEHRLIRRDGGVLWVSLRGRRVELDGEPRFMGVVINDTEEKLIEQKLQKTVTELRMLTENVPGGVARMRNDACYTISYISDGFLSLFGYTRGEVRFRFRDRFLNMIHPDDRAAVTRQITASAACGAVLDLVYRGVRKDGRLIWILNKGQLTRDETGEEYFYCVLFDVTESKRAEETLRISEERYRVISEQSDDIIFELNISDRSVFFTKSFHEKFGYDPVLIGAPRAVLDTRMIHPDDLPRYDELHRRLCAGDTYVETTLRIAKKSGDFIWCMVKMTQIFNDANQAVKLIGKLADVNEQYRERENLIERSQRDSLTGLYNKGTTRALIEKCIRTDGKNQNHAMFIIDVDNFKGVNDQLGHLFGDAVLSETAGKVQNLFRGSDIIGRIGGDEFLVFLKDLRKGYQLEEKARELTEVFRDAFSGEKKDYKISGSIGVARYPEDSTSYQELFKKADRALYYAKKNGKDQYAVYNQELHNAVMLSGGCDRYTVLGGEEPDAEPQKPFAGNIAEYIFRIFSDTKDMGAAINSVLGLVGRNMKVCRVYVFENSDDNLRCSNTYEWCREGVAPQKEEMTDIPYDIMGNYVQRFDENGLFYCRDLSVLPKTLRGLTSTACITSFLQVALWDDGHFFGFVGYDDCGGSFYPTPEIEESLRVIARIIGVFLLRGRAQRRLENAALLTKAVMNDTGAGACVVDPETMRLLYVNEWVRARGGTEGGLCYEQLQGERAPCAGCPMLLRGEDAEAQPRSVERIRNSGKRRPGTAAVEFRWVDGRRAFYMTCADGMKPRFENSRDARTTDEGASQSPRELKK